MDGSKSNSKVESCAITKNHIRQNSYEVPKEISIVALLSPACFLIDPIGQSRSIQNKTSSILFRHVQCCLVWSAPVLYWPIRGRHSCSILYGLVLHLSQTDQSHTILVQSWFMFCKTLNLDILDIIMLYDFILPPITLIHFCIFFPQTLEIDFNQHSWP